jgi:hypothetical protein
VSDAVIMGNGFAPQDQSKCQQARDPQT